jgi:hypothetical protein
LNSFSETIGVIFVIIECPQLESNLHHLAISSEWVKHVDSVVTIGSASHIVIASSRAKNGVGRKRGKYLDFESKPSSNASGGLRMYWWRGGRVSRQLFNWKVVPRSLVSKAARQGLQCFLFIFYTAWVGVVCSLIN